jgi:two-component system LytT family response regulator
MKLKTLIVDDEAAARSRLRRLLAAFPEVEVSGEAADGLEAVEQIVRMRPDLVFLDVQMPQMSGFEVLRALPREAPLPLVVFATAYDEYALAAFEADALGYLLKPVNRERLAQAVGRALQLARNQTRVAAESEKLRAVSRRDITPLGHIIARHRGRYLLLRPEQIVFFRVEDGLLRAYTEAENYWTDYQINDLEARLPKPPFFRAHRAIIVNLRRVREIAPVSKSAFLLVMTDHAATEIQVSERQAKRLREELGL